MEIFIVTIKGTLIDTEVHPFKTYQSAYNCVIETMKDFGVTIDQCEEICYECWKCDTTKCQDVEWELHHCELKD